VTKVVVKTQSMDAVAEQKHEMFTDNN